MEELGVEAGSLAEVEVIEHDYGDRYACIRVFEGVCLGEPFAADGAEWVWVTPAELASLPVPPANRALVQRLASGEDTGSSRGRVR